MNNKSTKELLPVNFLTEKDFAYPIFVGQFTPLFDPDAAALRAKLQTILSKNMSEENLEFLSALHRLNAQKNLAAENVLEELAKIDTKYIVNSAPSLLNIQPKTLNRIRQTTAKSLLDYRQAIKEVYELIFSNVLSDNKELMAIDKATAVKQVAIKLLQEINALAKLSLSPPSHPKAAKMSEYTHHVEGFITAAQSLRLPLTELITQTYQDDNNVANVFKKIVLPAIGDLSALYSVIIHCERKAATTLTISNELRLILDYMSSIDLNFTHQASNKSTKLSMMRRSAASLLSENNSRNERSSFSKSNLDSMGNTPIVGHRILSIHSKNNVLTSSWSMFSRSLKEQDQGGLNENVNFAVSPAIKNTRHSDK